MKKIIKIFLTTLLITITTFTYGMKDVYAASGTFSISAPSNVVIGQTFSVTFKATASKIFYWQYYVSYDASKLKLVSGSTTIQGEADNATTGVGSVSRTLKFTALKAGNASFSIASGDGAMNIDANFPPSRITYKTVSKTIEITSPVPKSTNNKLDSLLIDNVTLTPNFSTDVTDYTIELEPTTIEINVNATASDSKASITGAGKRTVAEGENKIEVVVTAENGSTKTYNINAIVKEFKAIEVTVDGKKYNIVRKKGLYEAPINFEETTIKMDDENVLAYTNPKIGTVIGLQNDKNEVNLYLYNEKGNSYTAYKTITIDGINLYLKTVEDTSIIPPGYERSSLKINEDVLITYNYNGSKDNYLIYGVNTKTGKEAFYQYNKTLSKIQPFDNTQICDLQTQLKLYLNVIIVISVVTCALLTTSIIMLIKLVKSKKISLSQDSFIDRIKKFKSKR